VCDCVQGVIYPCGTEGAPCVYRGYIRGTSRTVYFNGIPFCFCVITPGCCPQQYQSLIGTDDNGQAWYDCNAPKEVLSSSCVVDDSSSGGHDSSSGGSSSSSSECPDPLMVINPATGLCDWYWNVWL